MFAAEAWFDQTPHTLSLSGIATASSHVGAQRISQPRELLHVWDHGIDAGHDERVERAHDADIHSDESGFRWVCAGNQERPQSGQSMGVVIVTYRAIVDFREWDGRSKR
jgi:hypothetical protein